MQETSLGGTQGSFPETAWSLVVRLGADGTYRDAIGRLCTRYWKPVYRYVRLAWAKSNEDAKDLTQAFFAWLLEDEVLRRYVPERGGFRAFLKVVLKGFLGHQEEARQRLKRGGGVRIVPLDALLDVPGETDPEAAFDREWLDDVVATATEQLRAQCLAEGRELHWKIFEAHDLGDGEPPGYADLAARFGVKASDVRNWLFNMREAMRRQLRDVLAETTMTEADLEHEWRELFGG